MSEPAEGGPGRVRERRANAATDRVDGRGAIARRGASGILLAAGRGARFGGAKLLAPLPAASHGVAAGTPVGAASALHLLAALGDVIAVVRPGDSLLHDALAATGARVIVCPRADEGMGASLACGVAATPADAAASSRSRICRGSHRPRSPASRRRCATARRSRRPCHRGERGHPVGFAARHRGGAARADRRRGRAVDRGADPAAVTTIAVDDPGVVRDVDRPADLAPAT